MRIIPGRSSHPIFVRALMLKTMWLVTVLAAAYRPSNVLLPKRADGGDVVRSIRAMRARLPTNATLVRRCDVVTCDADDIVFDAIAGSRRGTGRVPTRPRLCDDVGHWRL